MLFGSLLNSCLRECSGQVMMKCRYISVSPGGPNEICPADNIPCILIPLLVNLNYHCPLSTFMEARPMHGFQRWGCSKIIAKITKKTMAYCLMAASWKPNLLGSPCSSLPKNIPAVQVSTSMCLFPHQNISFGSHRRFTIKKIKNICHEWKSIFELNFRLK